ncbi:MAG TPA: hypothetical protein VIN07_05380 [Flavipsychrobacter sp.]
MSAFYDIWIGTAAPHYKRSNNEDWQNVSGNIWYSLPGDKKFITVASNNEYQLTLIGQLYETVDANELLNRCVNYIQQPDNNYTDAAGHYIIFVSALATGDTYVFTNRMGSYHAYWLEDGAISTNYLALATTKKQKKLNWEGITGFMAMGYFPDDSTYIKGISIFEPATCYHFNSGSELIDKKRYWQWQYHPEDKPLESHLARLKDILQSSLAVSTNNFRTAIPISGGLDSRLLAGELSSTDNHTYRDLNAFSYGYTADSPELMIAGKIAEARHIPIQLYQLPNYLFQQIDEIAESVELFQYVDGTRQASAADWLRQNADVVVGGHWGDVWMNDMGVDAKGDLLPAFQKKIIKKGSQWLLDNVCGQHTNNSSEYLSDYFQSFISRHNNIGNADFLMKIYKTDQWSFRWTTASLRMYQAAVMPVLPFYDSRIVDFFCTVPSTTVNSRQMEIEYLKHYHKDLAKITWQEYDADLYNYKYFNNRNIAYRAAKKLQRLATGEKPIQRNWEIFYMNPEGRKSLEARLLNNSLLNELVPANKIKELLDDLYNNPSAANGYTVSMLLTFSIFLDKVFK